MEVDISEKVGKAVKMGLIVLLLLIVSGSAFVWWWQQSSTHLTIRGAKIASAMVDAKTKVAGTFVEYLVEDGAQVEAGQPLARLQVKITPEQIVELEKSLQAAKDRYAQLLAQPATPTPSAPVQSGGADLSGAQAALDRAARQKERMDSLFAIGGISAVQHKQAAAAYDAALAAYDAAQSAGARASQPSAEMSGKAHAELLKLAEMQIKHAQAALEVSKKNQEATMVMAPVSGTVRIAAIAAGDEVAAGASIGTVGDAEEAWVQASVPLRQSDRLRLGQFAECAVAGFAGATFKGTVFEIISEDEDGASLNEIAFKISLPPDLGIKVKPGMDVQVKISI